jgi:predicted RNA-binding Zn-ribbon protein involved in translation (DUF1610 family)
VYTWGLWDQNVSLEQIIEPGSIACWGAAWVGDNNVLFDSVHRSGEHRMLQGIYGLLDEAEAVVTYNGDKFDLPWLRGEFARYGMKPFAPARSIDLLKTVKKNFRFPSNKLQYVSQRLGIGKKLEHEGFPLWVKCMAGEAAAWKTMEEYNIQDVLLLEKLLNRLQGYVKNYPNKSVISGELVCPECGSTHITKRGDYVTLAGVYQRFQCQDCGKWMRSNKNERAGTDKYIPL